MTKDPPAGDKYGGDYWDRLWSSTISQHADKVASRKPNSYLTELAADLNPGRALDAGCGHGVEARWLAARGWQVSAVDFSFSALRYGEAAATNDGAPVSSRIEWIQADLGNYEPPSAHFDLVASLYVHVAHTVEDAIHRLSLGVAPGGLLLLVGHRPIDPKTGERTAAAGQNQVSVEAAERALSPSEWELLVSEERRRVEGQGVDAVVVARRRPRES